MNDTQKKVLEQLRLEPEAVSERGGLTRWLLIGVGVAGGVALLTNGSATPVFLKRAAGSSEKPPVTNILPNTQTSTALTASGYIVTRKSAVVSAAAPGQIVKLFVREGDLVRAGQLIAQLDPSEQQARVKRARAACAMAEAELASQRWELARAQRLVTQAVLPADQLASAENRLAISEAALLNAQAELDLQNNLLDKLQVRAPFSGTIIKKLIEVGEQIVPGRTGSNVSTSSEGIVVLADLSTLELEVDVSESHLGELRPRSRVEISVDAFPEERFAGVIRRIGDSADRTKGTVLVRVSLLEHAGLGKLRPEMTASGTFVEAGRGSGEAL